MGTYYESRDKLIEDVKHIGEVIIEKADEIIGDWSNIHSYTITAKITVDSVPQLVWTKEANALRIKTQSKEY